jgi:hypothetical protein
MRPRIARRSDYADEPLHGEHLLRSAIQAIDLAADDHEPARWHFRLDETDYLAESNGAQWSVTASPPPAPADVTVTATTQSLAGLIFTGSDAGIDITAPQGPSSGWPNGRGENAPARCVPRQVSLGL